jgi:UrcA family protein
MTTASKLTTFRRTLTFVGACAAMAVAPMSFAAPQSSSVPSIAVSYDDLNLATSAGVDALYHRISVAARSVCANPDIRDLGAVAAAQNCRLDAVARAVRDVNNPKLATVHAARVSHG